MQSLYQRMKTYAASGLTALIVEEGAVSYKQLCDKIDHYREVFVNDFVSQRTLLMHGNYELNSIAVLLAALLEKKIIMPITKTPMNQSELVDLLNADLVINASCSEFDVITDSGLKKSIVCNLLDKGNPGIVFLSSGTTGKPKAILHDADILLQKYLFSRRRYNTLAVMLFDHIAGFDTLFYSLSSGGALTIPGIINLDTVINTVREFGVEVLPASPSFIQMLMMDARFNKDYLATLKVITFGSERITDNLQENLIERFGGGVELIQKYGITEIGNPATITRKDDPRYIKFLSKSTEFKIIDDILYIKSNGSLLGYLNKDDCISFNGWFDTQDKVEMDGEWVKILGRVSDIINVGGQKVYPAEVESVLQGMEHVTSVSVFGKQHEIMGSVVMARVSLSSSENLRSFKKRMRLYCRDKLESYKIPIDIELVDKIELNDRFKKLRH